MQNGSYALATGTYQLRLTYFREGGTLLPLKEAGRTDPEAVRLDIPVFIMPLDDMPPPPQPADS